MNLVEIDGVDFEPLQARIDFLLERGGLQSLLEAIPFANQAALGENLRTVRAALEGARNNLLGMAEPVRGGCIDPVDTEIDGPVNRSNGLLVV
jgi:hypothetical protein